jgi:general secretion pathway protein I
MKRPRNKFYRQRGFTLLEIMVAVSIFALAGMAILKASQEHLRSLGAIQEQTFATWVANNQLTEATLKAQVQWPLRKDAKGEVEMGEQIWFWQQDVTATLDDSLFMVTISVATDEAMDNQITSVSTFIARPKPN